MEKVTDPFTIALFAFAVGGDAAQRGDDLMAVFCLVVVVLNAGRFLVNLADFFRGRK